MMGMEKDRCPAEEVLSGGPVEGSPSGMTGILSQKAQGSFEISTTRTRGCGGSAYGDGSSPSL